MRAGRRAPARASTSFRPRRSTRPAGGARRSEEGLQTSQIRSRRWTRPRRAGARPQRRPRRATLPRPRSCASWRSTTRVYDRPRPAAPPIRISRFRTSRATRWEGSSLTARLVAARSGVRARHSGDGARVLRRELELRATTARADARRLPALPAADANPRPARDPGGNLAEADLLDRDRVGRGGAQLAAGRARRAGP